MSFIHIIITFNAVLTSHCQNIEDLWLIGPEIIPLACICGEKIALQFSKFSNAISRKFWKTDIAAFCSQVHAYIEILDCADRAQTSAKASNLNQEWSGIAIRISRLIRIQIRISTGSIPKCCGFIILASVISPSIVKSGRWLYEKC